MNYCLGWKWVSWCANAPSLCKHYPSNLIYETPFFITAPHGNSKACHDHDYPITVEGKVLANNFANHFLSTNFKMVAQNRMAIWCHSCPSIITWLLKESASLILSKINLKSCIQQLNFNCNSDTFLGNSSWRLLPLPESGFQQPCGSSRPRNTAFLLHVAPPGSPRTQLELHMEWLLSECQDRLLVYNSLAPTDTHLITSWVSLRETDPSVFEVTSSPLLNLLIIHP